jgi:citrate lyase beta subunit
VAPARKPIARAMVTQYLAAHAMPRVPKLWVRINPLDEGEPDDLAAVVRAAPDGIVVPKTDGPADLQHLGHYPDMLERRDDVGVRIRRLSVAPETARARFRLGDYADMALPCLYGLTWLRLQTDPRMGDMALQCLYGLTWGAEDLSSGTGTRTSVDAAGYFTLSLPACRQGSRRANDRDNFR